MAQPDRNPLRKVAKTVSTVTGILTTLATAIVGYGVLTAVQGDALVALLGAIPGVVTALGVVLAAFQTAVRGENHVTPVDDPRGPDGVQLVPGPGSIPFPR